MSSGWQPVLKRDGLQRRAEFFSSVREFFQQRSVLEVDTPVLSRSSNTDPNLVPLQTRVDQETRYLHTSPEFFMKRMVAAGSGDIFSICRVFRDGEVGHLHNYEFVMLEWYRLGFSLDAMIDETMALLSCLLHGKCGPTNRRQSYTEAFREHVDIDPLSASTAALRARALELGVEDTGLKRYELLDAIAGVGVYPRLGKDSLHAVTHYPAAQAALAKIQPDDDRVALRFEVFFKGIELANGYCELRDADEQAQRFANDNMARRRSGKPELPVDHNLLRALHAGLPQCCGVAVGLDRVFMLAQGKRSINDIMPFPAQRT